MLEEKRKRWQKKDSNNVMEQENVLHLGRRASLLRLMGARIISVIVSIWLAYWRPMGIL